MDNSSIRSAFFDALPQANDADFNVFITAMGERLGAGMAAEALEGHLVVDGSWIEADAKALVAKLVERNLL